jgi:sarcosine oxidase
MGSSASYNLAKRGLRVLTLEQFGLGHEFGSSHGRTRIIRLAYYEDPRYVPLLRRAFAAWRELEQESGRMLLRMTGCLSMGSEDGELVSGVLASAKMHGLPHRKLTAREVNEEFPAFRIEEGCAAVFDDNGGILFPESCIGAFVEVGRNAGCDFRFSEQVTSWKRNGPVLEVETSKGSYSAGRIVLCGGPWMGTLTGGMLPLKVERQVPFWFSSEGDNRFAAGEMPVFIKDEEKGSFYGIPEVGHGVKVARHHQGTLTEADAVSRQVTNEDAEPVERFVSLKLPGLRLPHQSATTCLYTNTPDQNFAVGVHPDDPGVVMMSACSGHGFKFASVMGEIAADLAAEGKSKYDISFLDVARFGR